jgi:hypothetical protein
MKVQWRVTDISNGGLTFQAGPKGRAAPDLSTGKRKSKAGGPTSACEQYTKVASPLSTPSCNHWIQFYFLQKNNTTKSISHVFWSIHF